MSLALRADKPFVPINCGAIPSELVESEFFGHKKGAFTGAIEDKEGLFQAADGGTLLLDEVADLPLMMQVKLLRALQEKTIRPVGGHDEISVDVRVLCATHTDLAEKVVQGTFREDLFYRLNVIEVAVPALRERSEDIAILADSILEKLAEKNDIDIPKLSKNALKALKLYDFPGNVRELENILERAITWMEGSEISESDLMLSDNNSPRSISSLNSSSDNQQINVGMTNDLASHLEDQERQIILQALESVRWNKTAAAKKLGITFRALRYKLKKLDLE